MEELKANEARTSLEDIMYVSVLEKFVELGVEMMPHLQQGPGEENSAMFKALTEGIHSLEALDMVRDHVRSIMGPASMAFQNTMLQMSKLQAAQASHCSHSSTLPGCPIFPIFVAKPLPVGLACLYELLFCGEFRVLLCMPGAHCACLHGVGGYH